MLREKNYLFQSLSQLLDAALIVVAFGVALWSRNVVVVPNLFPTQPVVFIAQHHWLIWIMAPAVILAQKFLGAYDSQRMSRAGNQIFSLGLSTAFASVLALGIVVGLGRAFGGGLQVISKPQVIYFALWIFALLTVKALVMRRFFLRSEAAASM